MSKATEIHVRQKTKQVLKYIESLQHEEAKNVILENKEILSYNLGLINFVPLIPRIRFSKKIPRNNEALKMIIKAGVEIFEKEENIDELLFFVAANCDPEKLLQCVQKILNEKRSVNQVREGDTVLMFMIKYGNLSDKNFSKCVKILVENGVDVTRKDYFKHSPIGFLEDLYNRYSKRSVPPEVVLENLKNSIELVKSKLVELDCLSEDSRKNVLESLPLSNIVEEKAQESTKDKLFKLLLDSKEEDFIKSKEVVEILNEDDGNNTFLQLCCEKKLQKACFFLIEKGADVCRTAQRNKQTPLEIAARRNHSEIFQKLISSDKIIIDEELFQIFLRARPKHIKAKYFDELLKHKNLDLNIRSNNGNTPLHYAIIFSSTEAINVLLKRGASLMVENDSGKTPLDYISAEDLENYLDKCVVQDSYNDINNGKYEIGLNFEILVEESKSELSIIGKVSNSQKLCHLLDHPVLSTFVDIKWKLIEPLYHKLFAFQIFFYVISILSFINLNFLHYLALPLSLLYSLRIWSTFNWKSNKLHEVVDISIASILFLSFLTSNNTVKYQFGVISTVFMAISFHLLWRFSPHFSHFHVVLLNVVSKFFSYLFYIFSLVLFFGAAFYIIFLLQLENQHNFFYDYNLKVITPHFYLVCTLAIFFGVMITMTVINSVAHLQEKTERVGHFEVLGCKNTLLFLQSLERFHSKYGTIQDQRIFDESEDDCEGKEKTKKRKNRRFVNFYINTNKFAHEKLLSIKLSRSNVIKLQKAIHRQTSK